MMPPTWVILTQMPLTLNGKLDRQALPAPQGRSSEMGEYIPSRTTTECVLADIWAELLEVDRVGVQDNFFELGGDSLRGMKLIAKIAEHFNVHLPVIALFKHPDVEQMSNVIESLRTIDRKPSVSEETESDSGVL
jgi:surfactin family lipopeptide synthetase A